MFGLKELRKVFSDPFLALREINRLYYRRLGYRSYNPSGIDIFEADWDNLIILDACRYDIFKDHASIPGRLETRTSRGGATPEFIRGNFSEKTLDDTVYVTGNDWFLQLRDEINAEIHAVYNPDGSKPVEMTERVLEVASEYPNKRILAHYIPPHHPFVGETASEHFPDFEDQLDALFERVRRGELDVSDQLLRQAYIENLERVVPEAQRLVESLEGKTVVTGDHGELLGERTSPLPVRDYGHHAGLYVIELVTVPWLVNESGNRRTIVSETPDQRSEVDQEEVTNRLQQLGYKV